MPNQRSQFQPAASIQTLAEALAEYYAANPESKRGDALSPDARDFFRSHDVVHVIYGCGTSMPDEAVVKLASLFGTTGGFSTLRGYRLHESMDIYRHLPLGSTIIALLASPYLIVRTLWRCSRQHAKWPWVSHEQHMQTPLRELRAQFGIEVIQQVEPKRSQPSGTTRRRRSDGMSESGRLILVILHASNLERTLHFYRDLLGLPLEPGFNEPESDPWYGGHHAELSWREGAYLHFALFPSRPPEQPVTTGAEIGLLVDSVSELHERLTRSGAEVLHEPRREPWGVTARYLDPDGNIVGITAR